MGFITKNANMILLFLIMLSAASLVGATVFFQMNFEKINTEYNQKLQQLQTVSKQLETEQAVLDSIKGELSVKSVAQEQLGQKFTEVKTTKEQLETQKAQLETTKEQLQSELDNTETSLKNTQADLDTAKGQVDTLNAQNADLTSKFSTCETKRAKAESDLAACKTNCSCP